MSKGMGAVERRIADLFAETRDRALSVDDVTDAAFGLDGTEPSRAQRLSATRAAHRLLRRVQDTDKRARALRSTAHRNAETALGVTDGSEFWNRLHQEPAWQQADKLGELVNKVGAWSRLYRDEDRKGWFRTERDYWCTTTTAKGRLHFHPPDAPVQVWAVSVQPAGVLWADAEVVRITERNVMVRYAHELARLDRKALWHWWAFWRGVQFVSSRTGRIAAALDELWQDRYGHAAGGVPPVMQMPLAEAMALLGAPADYTSDDVIALFRREAKKAHPDAGGTAEQFRALVEARDRLLAAIGTSAPAPKMPTYAPKGVQVVYRAVRPVSGRRLGATRRLAGA